jgi:hypothetical protein
MIYWLWKKWHELRGHDVQLDYVIDGTEQIQNRCSNWLLVGRCLTCYSSCAKP